MVDFSRQVRGTVGLIVDANFSEFSLLVPQHPLNGEYTQ